MNLIYFMAILGLAGIIAVGEASATIKADSCKIRVLQFFDRTYEGTDGFVDDTILSLFSDPKLGNYSDVELVDINQRLYNRNVDKAYEEALKTNLESGDYYAKFYTSCGKYPRNDKLKVKDDEFKWVYKCKLSMTIGQYTENGRGHAYDRDLVDSVKHTVKMKLKDELSMEQEDTIRYLLKHHASDEQQKEEFFKPLRRENMDEMKEYYRKAIEGILRHNKFSCQEKK